MDRVHDYESCDIGSIPIMSVFARIVQWIEHGSSKAMILVRFQVWVFIFLERWQRWIIAPVLKTGNRQ